MLTDDNWSVNGRFLGNTNWTSNLEDFSGKSLRRGARKLKVNEINKYRNKEKNVLNYFSEELQRVSLFFR